ncbi:hypothetical protein [Streptomyces sp. NPDC088726]|uniref:hypothetical protein n=1 Tax=Streptomyces sp. NPDC088726 TaxID=3365874 RepID=UPI0037F7BF8A
MNWGNARRWVETWAWGDVGAWVAVVLALAALVVSIRAQRDGRKSADAAVASVEEARLSRLASERSAKVAEQTLLDQRQEAAERRIAEAEANRPRPAFTITRSRNNEFYLRNSGTGPAAGVTVLDRGFPDIGERPENQTLAPDEAVDFRMLATAGSSIPSTLYVVWDGQEEGVPVAVPAG